MGRPQNMGGNAVAIQQLHRKAGRLPIIFFTSKQLPAG